VLRKRCTRARRFELLEELPSLDRLEFSAHQAGADHPAAWGALALVHSVRPALLAELTILENCGAADLLESAAPLPAAPKSSSQVPSNASEPAREADCKKLERMSSPESSSDCTSRRKE
jgi:hypothetical protein